MKKVFLALGSNLGNRKKNLEKGLTLLKKMGIRIIRRSRIYETEPVGFPFQPRFLNIVVEGETEMSPKDCLLKIKEIEKRLKRVRFFKNAPRTLDIDLLFYNQEIIEEGDLQIPHPRIPERLFVLRPLSEIAPDFYHPKLKKRIEEMVKECGDGKGIKLYCD
uniref:2-amino-4-hydroxy-6-hydroxymethyldihydropteridine diphosphokinase n=1 Tax=candidate division WOR-3 bacterium TaxID=2052148 RepID=A0A7C3YSV3_UNCW3